MSGPFLRWLILLALVISTIPWSAMPSECAECPPEVVEAPGDAPAPVPTTPAEPCRDRCACPCGPLFLVPHSGVEPTAAVHPTVERRSPLKLTDEPHLSEFVERVFHPPRSV